MKLTELVRTRRREETQAKQQTQSELYEEYRSLIYRGNDATEADVERILELMNELSISDAQFEIDQLAVSEQARLEAGLGTRDELTSQIEEVESQIRVINEKIRALRGEAQPLTETKRRLEEERNAYIGWDEQITNLRNHFAMLLTGHPFSGRVADRMNLMPPAEISNRMRSLGMEPRRLSEAVTASSSS